MLGLTWFHSRVTQRTHSVMSMFNQLSAALAGPPFLHPHLGSQPYQPGHLVGIRLVGFHQQQ
jgi:hypothetical protein